MRKYKKSPKAFELNQDAIIAWMYVGECSYMEKGAIKDGEVFDLSLNLMKHYPTEFDAIQMVRLAMIETKWR